MNLVWKRFLNYPLFSEILAKFPVPALIPLSNDSPQFDPSDLEISILQLHRNSRAPKKANHGKRPNSSVMRRLKKKAYYHKRNDAAPGEGDDDEKGSNEKPNAALFD